MKKAIKMLDVIIKKVTMKKLQETLEASSIDVPKNDTATTTT